MLCFQGVDSFSLLHHDLNICTNSPQYLMILDIVNNLLLHSEPKKKELLEKVQSMRFQLHLTSVEDQRTPILNLQNNLRESILLMRKLEKEVWLIQKALDDHDDERQRHEGVSEELVGEEAEDTDMKLQLIDIDHRMSELKEQINEKGDQLAVMVR